jgi:hypothetical protein
MMETTREQDSVAVAEPEITASSAVQAAYLGFFVDMFDVYLPIAVLAPALPYFTSGGVSAAARATIFYVVFAVTPGAAAPVAAHRHHFRAYLVLLAGTGQTASTIPRLKILTA